MDQAGLERLFAIVLAALATRLTGKLDVVAYKSLICPDCVIGSVINASNCTVTCPQFNKRGQLSIIGFPAYCPGGAVQNSATERWLFTELFRRGGTVAVQKYCDRQDIMKRYGVSIQWQELTDLADKNADHIEDSGEFKTLIMAMESLYWEMNR